MYDAAVTSDFLWYLPTHGDGRGLAAGAFHKGARGNTHPNLEEAVRVGEDLLPLLRARTAHSLQARELSLVEAS